MQDIFWEFGLPVVSDVYVYLYTINPLLNPTPCQISPPLFKGKKLLSPPPPRPFQGKKVIKSLLSFKPSPPFPSPFILKW